MKNVLKIKSKFFYVLALMIILSCNKNNKQENIILNNRQKIVDTTKGIFIEYPFLESIDYLEEKNDNEIIQIVLEKRTTKDSLNYFIKVRSYKKSWNSWNSKLIISRNIQDYSPFLDAKLDNDIESKFYRTPKKSFVVKFEYGTGHVTWNYLYQIDSTNKKLFLKDIFYIEPYKNNLGFPQDTLAYLVKIKIDKEINHIPIKKMDSLFNYFNEIENKSEKWITK